MKIRCEIILDYKKKQDAKTVYQSTKVDDFEFVNATVHDTQVKTTIESTSVSSLLHTLDDYLACVSVAETVVDKD